MVSRTGWNFGYDRNQVSVSGYERVAGGTRATLLCRNTDNTEVNCEDMLNSDL